MQERSFLKRIGLGAVVIGLTGAIALSASDVSAAAAANPEDESAVEMNAPASDPSAVKGDEQKRHHKFRLFEDASRIIGIDEQELKKQLHAGKSLAEVAQSKGISEVDLIDRLLAVRVQKIDEAVKAGKIPQEKADRVKDQLPQRLKEFVNKKDWKEWKGPKEHDPKGHDSKRTDSPAADEEDSALNAAD